MSDNVSASAWMKGIALSVLASMIGGASKLAIRKSWLMEAVAPQHLLTEIASQPDDNDEEEEHHSSYTSLAGNSDDEDDNDLVIERHSKRTKRIALSLRLGGMLGMTFLNPLCCVLAMNYASPSILAPFSGLTLVWIVLFSNSLIGETPTRPQVLAASLVVLGEVFVAAFGDHQNDDHVTLEELRKSYLDPCFISFLVGMVFWMLLLFYWMKCGRSAFMKRFAWGAAGGSITGLQNFLKDSLTILKARHGTFPWYLPVMVLCAIVTAFVGLLLLTACMKRYDATYSSAMFVGSFVISASVMSAVHYKTFSNLEEVYDYVLYPLGLLILMAGVYILVHETAESPPEAVIVPPSSPSASSSSSQHGSAVETRQLSHLARNTAEGATLT